MNTQTISGVECFYDQQHQKWIPKSVGSRFSDLYSRHPDAPDFVTVCEACNAHHFDVTVPFETFVCGYLWQGNLNNTTSQLMSDTNMKLVNMMAENKVLTQKLKEVTNQLQQLATEYATFRNNVGQSDWQRAINEKDTVIANLQNKLQSAEDEVNAFLQRKQAMHDEEIRNKTKEIADLQSRQLDQQIRHKEDHFNQLSQKDDEIYKLRSDLANIQEELKKAKKEARLSLYNANDKSLNKELQMADNLTKFKRVTWSLLEKVLISYENTMLYIDNVENSVKDCQIIVNTLMSDIGNLIKTRFDRVPVPNIKESQASVKQFEDKYLGDVKEEVEQVKRTYGWDSLPSKRLDSFETNTSDQSEFSSTN